MVKIVLIGAGSSQFGLGTVSDIFKSETLKNCNITLHDINEKALEKTRATAEKYKNDSLSYLNSDILVKLDRASMSVSLESRVPFLDHRIIDFAFKLPTAHLIQKSRGKVLLRKFLSGRVPSNILELPKSGFGVPIENWLRSGLREWSQQLLFHEKDELRLFDNETIKTAWNEHISNKRLRHHQIWSVLMLKLWNKKTLDKKLKILLKPKVKLLPLKMI